MIGNNFVPPNNLRLRFVFYSTDEQGERNRNRERERRRNLGQGQHEVRRCSGKIKFRVLAKFV